MKSKFQLIFGKVVLPERFEVKPTGRIILFGKELWEKEKKNYCKALRTK